LGKPVSFLTDKGEGTHKYKKTALRQTQGCEEILLIYSGLL
jgi:hypothetical protein